MSHETFQQIGTRIGALVTEKNAAYGSSFEVAPQILALLYPNGITVEQYSDMLVQVRIIDKQMRIATDRDAFGESPYGDIAGYGILGVAMHQEKKQICGTASVAQPESQEPAPKSSASSAAPNAPASTTTTASALRELPLMPPWKIEFAPSSPNGPVTAPSATVVVSLEDAVAGVLRKSERHKAADLCSHCQRPASGVLVWRWRSRNHEFIFCSAVCWSVIRHLLIALGEDIQ